MDNRQNANGQQVTARLRRTSFKGYWQCCNSLGWQTALLRKKHRGLPRQKIRSLNLPGKTYVSVRLCYAVPTPNGNFR